MPLVEINEQERKIILQALYTGKLWRDQQEVRIKTLPEEERKIIDNLIYNLVTRPA